MTLCTSFQQHRRFILNGCPSGTELHCHHNHYGELRCYCIPTQPVVNGGWSEWSSSPCSTTCGDGTKHETRSCTNPAPLHGGRHCQGDSVRVTPCHSGQCPTTTPIPTKCSADVNCTGFNCPRQQYPFCEPNLDWSACGCTECTDHHHCTCSTGMIGHCRDDIFERKCECKQVPVATCKSDSDCSTHVCTGNLSQSFCHEKKFLVFDLSSCDCRGCSKDSDCHCQSRSSPSCQATAFGNTCQCNQVTESSTHSTHSAPTRTTSITKPTSPTTTTTTTSTVNTQSQTTKAATTSTTITPMVSSDPLHESTVQPTHMTSIEVTKSTTDATTNSTQTLQSTKTTIPENNTSFVMVTLTTKPQGVRKCHICGDSPNSIPCDTRAIYMGDSQNCAPGENYCMTDLIHNGQSFPNLYKRCVTEEECRDKWLHQTSDLEYCTNYGNVLAEGHYSCHFCCTSDGCNSNQIPDKSTLYIKV